MTDVDATSHLDNLEAAAKNLGAERGAEAGATCRDTGAELPECDFSGQWADTPSPRDVMADIIDAAARASGDMFKGVGQLDASSLEQEHPEAFFEITEAFRHAYDETAEITYRERPSLDDVSSSLPASPAAPAANPEQNR